MLTKKQISEIREHLEKAQNPLFLFDNDQDGLCSFLLLQRFIKRGKGFPVKNSHSSGKDYIRKINEFNSDYVFILDVPEFSEEFFNTISQINIPVVWIDHHEVDFEIPENINYYNPLLNNEKTNEPVTALCYSIVGRKEDAWLGVVGCISDNFVPDFYFEFLKNYPDLGINSENAFDIFYCSEIGRIARIFGFALKDRVSNVISMIKFLMKIQTPYEVIEESGKNKEMHRRFEEIGKKYDKLILKAKKKASGKLLFFKYAGNMSISSEIANGLKYFFPDKVVVVVHTKDAKTNVSARGENIRKAVLQAIEGFENATGGGHANAAGAQIRTGDLKEFEKRMKANYNN